MINLGIKVLSKIVERKIKKLEKTIKNREKLNKRIGIRALKEVDKQFRTEGTNFKTPWETLKKETLLNRRQGKGRGGTKILRDTGRLANSFVFEADKNKVVIGSNLKYSHNHQKGTTVPQREMLPEDNKLAYEQIAKPVIKDWVKNEVKKANK